MTDGKKPDESDARGRVVPPTQRMNEGGTGQRPEPTKRMDAPAADRPSAGDLAGAAGVTRRMDAARDEGEPQQGRDAEAFIQPAAVPAGTVLRGKYEIEKQIGLGAGQADIYLCRVVGAADKRVVVKLYWGRMQPNAAVLQKLRGVRHPDIISFLDCGEIQGRFFEVMEYAAGGSLSDRLPARPFTEKELTTVVVPEVLNGLTHCHDMGIIHRDIKESNLYYRNADKTDVVLGDFGISSQLEGQESLHYTSRNFLTLVYAAPELLLGGGRDGRVTVGPEVDYYALGITLMFLMNANPFPGIDEHRMMRLKLCNEVPLPERISDRFATFLRGLMHPNPKSRWGAAKVQAWLRGEDVAVDPTQVVRVTGIEYRIGNETPGTLAEMAKLLQDHPREAIADIARGTVARAVDMFDVNIGREIAAIVERPGTPESRHVEVVHTLDRTLPYALLPGKKVGTPEELARLIDSSLEAWTAGIAQLKNGILLAWLRAIGPAERVERWEAHAKAIAASGSDDIGLESFLRIVLDPKLAAPQLVLSRNAFEITCDDSHPKETLELQVSSGGRGHVHGSVQIEGGPPGISIDTVRVAANRLRDMKTTIRISIDTSTWERGPWREFAIVLDTNASSGRGQKGADAACAQRTAVRLRVRNAFPTRVVLLYAGWFAALGALLAGGYRIVLANAGHSQWLNHYFGHYVDYEEAASPPIKGHGAFALLPVLVVASLIMIGVVSRRKKAK